MFCLACSSAYAPFFLRSCFSVKMVVTLVVTHNMRSDIHELMHVVPPLLMQRAEQRDDNMTTAEHTVAKKQLNTCAADVTDCRQYG